MNEFFRNEITYLLFLKWICHANHTASISQQTEIPLLIGSPEAEMICFLFYFCLWEKDVFFSLLDCCL